MEKLKENITDFWSSIQNFKNILESQKKYRSNIFYTKKYKSFLPKLKKNFLRFEKRLKSLKNNEINFVLDQIDTKVRILLSDATIQEKIQAIEDIELLQPNIEVQLEHEDLSLSRFIIPNGVPQNEVRVDFKEAIKDFNNVCYISSLVLCRRAYEGALAEKYREIEKKDPIKEIKCKNCKKILGKGYIGIANLHKWAVDKKLISHKMASLGYLISDLGAGGSHPSHPSFLEIPRDEDIAETAITNTKALLKQVYGGK